MNKVVICGIDASNLPRLTQEEGLRLIKLAKAGDEAAKDQFLLGNMRLVLSIIKRFPSAKESADDLFQAGCIGLIKALQNFDESYNVMFSTYAVPMIVGEIKRVIRCSSGIRVSRSIRDTALSVLRTRSMIEQEDELPSIEEIARRMNTTEAEVVYALDAISDPISLHEPVYSKDGDELELMDSIKDEKSDEKIWNEKLALEQAIEKLGEREKDILYMRYFEGKTQTEISGEIGLSQAQISRLEKTALKEIKQKLN